MIWLAIAAGVIATSGLLVAGICAAASRGDRDDPPPPEHQPSDAGLFQIPPPEEDR